MSEISASHEAEIRRMIESTGVARTMRIQLSMTVTQMGLVDPESEEMMTALVDRLDTSELLENLIPVYAAHYTEEMASAVADFYSTEIGQAFIAAQPDIMADSLPITNAWVMSAAQDVMMGLMMGGMAETIH